MDQEQRTARIAEVTEMYDAYLRARERARAESRGIASRYVEDASRESREALSKAMQEAHADGVLKGELRAATRTGNNPAFANLYTAYRKDEG